MLENEFDDDDDIVNTINTIFEPDDDTHVELDEEEYTKEVRYIC
jgi:hypothetical protein